MRRSALLLPLLLAACLAQAPAPAPATQPAAASLPPGEEGAKARLNSSPRHGEFVEIAVAGSKTPLKAYVVFPERADKAPVVIVVMEIFGLSDWLRATTDQLAADGFIAIAPDFLSGKGPKGGGTDDFPDRDAITKAVSGLPAAEVIADCNAAREYGLKLPAANGKSASIGFCWGGGMSFLYAAKQPELNAAVVFYGTPPRNEDDLKAIKAPIFAFYGGSDNRVTSTAAPTAEKMKALNKPYTPHVYEGAGHGFVRAQGNPANLKATQQAWPEVVKFITDNTK